MPSNKYRSRNLGLLARRFKPFREKAVKAIEVGQDIIAAAMANRVPVHTGKLKRSIRKTKIKNDHARHRIIGRVIVTDRRLKALSLEYGSKHNRPYPFVRPTQANEGPLAVRAMVNILKG